MIRTRTVALIGVVVFALVACGDDEAASPEGGSADRAVEVDMVDIAFAPVPLFDDGGVPWSVPIRVT